MTDDAKDILTRYEDSPPTRNPVTRYEAAPEACDALYAILVHCDQTELDALDTDVIRSIIVGELSL